MQRTHNNRWPQLLLLLVLLSLLAACGPRITTGEMQVREESVSRQDAGSVAVKVAMGGGQLKIAGGSRELMEATFTYNVDDWEPEVEYAVSDGVGRLEISQPNVEEIGIPDNDIRYEWELRFNEETPLEMEVALGAGENNLDLASLNLRSLEMNTGAGEVDVNLGGSLESLRMETGAGEANLNLAHRWEQDLDAEISGGIGSTTILLPSDVGVRVQVRQGLGSVNASGLTQDGNTYTNEAYGQSEVTLEITVEGGIGDVTLRVGG